MPLRAAASPGTPLRMHSWKELPHPGASLKKVTGVLGMLKRLCDVSSGLEHGGNVTEECRCARRLMKCEQATISFLRAYFCNLVEC